MPRKKRDYRREYDEYHGTAEQRKNRSKRNKARRKLKLRKGDGREVDHKKPLSKGWWQWSQESASGESQDESTEGIQDVIVGSRLLASLPRP